MERNKINIDKTYSETFASFEMKPAGDHWDKVYRKVSAKNFLKFRSNKFNIYYAGLFSASLLVSLYIIPGNRLPEDKKTPVVPVNSILTEKTEDVKTVVEKKENKSEKKAKPVKKEIVITNVTEDKVKADNVPVADTNRQDLGYNDSVILTQQPEKKERKIKVIYKTIEKRDTVYKIKNRDENNENDNFTRKKSRKRK